MLNLALQLGPCRVEPVGRKLLRIRGGRDQPAIVAAIERAGGELDGSRAFYWVEAKQLRALAEPFSAFPSWFLQITCERCGKVQLVNQAHVRWDATPLHEILARMRHHGCGGQAGKAELLTAVHGVSSRPVRRIVLRAG